MMAKRPIYLDYQSTTPVDPAVVEAMLPFFTEHYGNPHSATHVFGWESEGAMEKARKSIAELIGAEAETIVFTSGATESNNLALKGVMQAFKGKKNHLITLASEHSCTLEVAKDCTRDFGADVTVLGVGEDGLVNLDELRDAITDQTVLVSIMAVNNEIGVIQPLAAIGKICHERGVFSHTDAAQGFGKIPLDVEAMNIDLLSLTGHKIYGPMGIGALYVRRKPRVPIIAQMSGGGQEGGLRSGTMPTPLCVGLGKAADVARAGQDAESRRLKGFSDQMIDILDKGLGDSYKLNGSRKNRIPGNLNLSFEGIPTGRIIAELRGIAISAGSACGSAKTSGSKVLAALGLSDQMKEASIRVGMGRYTTEEEVLFAANLIVKTVKDLRAGRL
jgi:cysteine desulfurase